MRSKKWIHRRVAIHTFKNFKVPKELLKLLSKDGRQLVNKAQTKRSRRLGYVLSTLEFDYELE